MPRGRHRDCEDVSGDAPFPSPSLSASPSMWACDLTALRTPRSIYKLHDDVKDKEFELEMSWVCDESGRSRATDNILPRFSFIMNFCNVSRKHVQVPADIRKDAIKAAVRLFLVAYACGACVGGFCSCEPLLYRWRPRRSPTWRTRATTRRLDRLASQLCFDHRSYVRVHEERTCTMYARAPI